MPAFFAFCPSDNTIHRNKQTLHVQISRKKQPIVQYIKRIYDFLLNYVAGIVCLCQSRTVPAFWFGLEYATPKHQKEVGKGHSTAPVFRNPIGKRTFRKGRHETTEVTGRKQ